jgi:hypothetical protein
LFGNVSPQGGHSAREGEENNVNTIKKFIKKVLYGDEGRHCAWEFPGVHGWPVPVEVVHTHDPLRPAPAPTSHRAA